MPLRAHLPHSITAMSSSNDQYACCAKVSYHKGTPTGKETKLGDRPCYVAGAEDADKAVLIVADVHGWSLPNTRMLADNYAKEIGARVYLPDFFDGHGFADQAKAAGANPLEFKGDVPALLGKFHPREQAWPAARAAVDAIRAAQPSAKKLGAIGFCWGAPSVLHLGSKAAGASKIDAVGFAHPSVVETSDFENLETNGTFICCETDAMFPAEKREAAVKACEKIAKDKGVFCKFNYYPNTVHGFSIRGDENDAYIARAMRHSFADAATHFRLELS